MCWKNLVVSALLVSSCAATKRPAVLIPDNIDKPYLTLADSCSHNGEATDKVVCDGPGFRRALIESANQTKFLNRLRVENEALLKHHNVDIWDLENQRDIERHKRQEAENARYLYLGGGVLGGIVATVLAILLAN